MSDILKVQQSFARKAQAQQGHRFEDLYHLICRGEWITEALTTVLSNTGARTAGIDGMNREDLRTDTQRQMFVKTLQNDLKTGQYRPSAVRRAWIDKPGKPEKRGLGIPTLRDRVVQELLRMLMEPIWESNFLDCSSGFRPGRRTMDCMATFYKRVTTQNKFFWAIEGDIRKCFDRIHHGTLLNLIRQRVADGRIVNLIEAFLSAGVMDGALFHDTPEGTPQGGILSPLLANIYLHQLDLWWWNKFGKLTVGQKQWRRQTKRGNALLVRYADDFVLLWNGTHQDALKLRAELKQFLWTELHLELSDEKTHVTHLTDGLDFLGFHIQWQLPKHNHGPWLRVTPTRTNLKRFRAKIKALTQRGTTYATPEMKLKSLNRLIRGWGNYYRHVSFSHDASKLDYWINRRVLIWFHHKHQRRGVRWLLANYKRREKFQQHNRWNLGVQNPLGQMLFVAKLQDIHLTSYLPKNRSNPYLDTTIILKPSEPESPFLDPRLLNITPEGVAWKEKRAQVLERDKGRCVQCGTHTRLLDVHHIIPRRERRSTDDLSNLVTLCQDCHQRTQTYGHYPREEKT
jgi:RNA-directed DNA polymerase